MKDGFLIFDNQKWVRKIQWDSDMDILNGHIKEANDCASKWKAEAKDLEWRYGLAKQLIQDLITGVIPCDDPKDPDAVRRNCKRLLDELGIKY